MENKYQRGKIYKIVDSGYNKCYIGSTIETLSNRISKHRRHYNFYKAGEKNKITLFDIFDEYGIENCKIELIENFPCDSIEELRKREGNYIQDTDCINRCVAGRKKSEWHLDNKEHNNEKSRNTYYNNREYFLNKFKEYAQENKELIRARQGKVHLCECGRQYTHQHKLRHQQSKNHLRYIQPLNKTDG